MSRNLQELCIADPNSLSLWKFTTPEKAEADTAEAKAHVAEHLAFWEERAAKSGESYDVNTANRYRRADYRVMTFGDFLRLEREKLLSDPMEEITAERFEEMSGVLPPLAWTKQKGVEMFCSQEFFTGTYTNQYAHDLTTGKYYAKMVDFCDRSTWISEILYPEAEI